MQIGKKVLLIALLCVSCMGCSTSSKKFKVAVIVKSTTSQFFKSVQLGASAACKEYNMELFFMGPDNEEDYQSQIAMVDKAVSDHMDAIVISSIDYDQLVEPVDKAVTAGIPVIVVDSDVHSDKVSARITTDNFASGQMAGFAVQEQQGDIVLGIVNFYANTANGQERENGLRSELEQDERVKAIYAVNVSSNVESATQATKQLIKEHPSINTIVTFNEWTTLGVGYAIKNEALSNDIYVVGFDNNIVSVEMLETGEVDALIVQTPFTIGYLGVEEAQNILTRKTTKKNAVVHTNTVLVNKENMFDEDKQKIVFPFD